MSDQHRIAEITLDERTVLRRNQDIEHERRVAIFDLLEGNYFRPLDGPEGPYKVMLGIEENRLFFDIRTEAGAALERVYLALSPFRRTVKEYFIICESYFDAIKRGTRNQIEALDVGRRGLHNDGSELLRGRLKDKIEVDFDTARRLFTLICVLHIRG